jgi:phage tail-like protein
MTQGAHDAITAARFSITVDGYEIASFSELTGITTSIDVVDFRQSTDKGTVVTRNPGQHSVATLTLKRGKTASMELWAWHEAVRNGEIVGARKSCSLVMYGYDGKPVARYYCENAWVSKIEIGALKAGANEMLMETVTIVCEHIQRVAP